MTIVAPTEIGISCFHIDEMVEFYVSAFSFELINKISVPANASMGLPLSDDGYTVARLQTPFGERLKLLGSNGARAAACEVRKSKNILKEPNTSFMTFIVNDIEATTGRAISFGATSMGSIVKIRPDLAIVFMLDPEGNYIELAQYDDISQYRPDLRVL